MYMRYFDLRWSVLQPVWNKQTRFYESRVEYIFVPKFYHDRASHGFLHLRHLGKIQESSTIS